MIKLEENSIKISGNSNDIQAEYIMITETLLDYLKPIDKYVLFIATAQEFIKSFNTEKEDKHE